MQLLIINGSPKPEKSNTQLMAEKFEKGIEASNELGFSTKIMRIAKDTPEAILGEMENSSHIVIAFPLYGYAMPAAMHQLLNDAVAMDMTGKRLSYIIQYGFMEAVHGRPIEKYLVNYTKRVGASYGGSIVKGGCDNLYYQQETANGLKVLDGLTAFGSGYGKTGLIDETMSLEFSKPEVQKKKSKFVMRIFVWMANRFYWKKKYTANGVSEEDSFAKPYA